MFSSMKKLLLLIHLLFAATSLVAQIAAHEAENIQLIPLPYATDALAPAISKQTIELHYGKHLRGYVTKLNTLIKGTKYAERSLLEIVHSSGGSIFDNAGQILNHNLYFTQFVPGGKVLASGKLQAQLIKDYGSVEQFMETFEQEGLSLFGSGWLWLSLDKHGRLVITKEANGSNPIVKALKPLLGVDLWEHAYYLDYQNKRADHIKSLWSIIDWSVIEARYTQAKTK